MKLKFVTEKQLNTDVFSTSITGPEGTLKTGTALEWPDPIVLIAFDTGYGAAVKRALGMKKRVHVEVMPVVSSTFKPEGGVTGGKVLTYDPEQGKQCWEKYKECLNDLLGTPDVGTVVVDTASMAQRICRIAHFGKLTQVQGFHYGAPNHDYLEVHESLMPARKCHFNTVFIHHVKEIYKGEKPTGEFKIDGNQDMLKLCDLSLLTNRDKLDTGEGIKNQVTFTFDKCRPNIHAVGTELCLYTPDGTVTGDISYEMIHATAYGV